jgi:hypothetical protein
MPTFALDHSAYSYRVGGSGFIAGRSIDSNAVSRLPGSFLNEPAIQIRQQLGDRKVQLPQREELAVAKPREDPALHHQHAHLDGGFVLRVIRTRWKDRAP